MAGLKKQEIYKTIKALAKCQGFYCRVLQAIEKDKTILDKLEKQKFKDKADMVIALES